MGQILLHIGYQKTGSTWLRMNLFNNKDFGFTSPYNRYELLEQLVYPHALDFNEKICRDYFQSEIDNNEDKNMCLTISLERLSGNPVSGGYDSKELAERLIRTFPEGKILITIREQKSIIESSYKEYVKSGGPSSLWNYLNPPLPKRIPYFDFDHYKYHRLINYYFQLFGSANILVLPFEQFNNAPFFFTQQLLNFVFPQKDFSDNINGLPFAKRSNVGYSGFELMIKRHLSMAFGERNSLNLHSIFPIGKFERGLFYLFQESKIFNLIPKPIHNYYNKKMKSQISQLIENKYSISNNKTSELTEIDLAKYGYETA